MRRPISAAARLTFEPGVLVFGALAAVLSIAVVVGLELVFAVAGSPIDRGFLAVAVVPLVAVSTVPPLVGVYARARSAVADQDERPAGSDRGSGAGQASGGVRILGRLTADVLHAHGRTLGLGLVLWLPVALLVGLAVAVVLHAVALPVVTAGQFLGYWMGMDVTIDPVFVLVLGGLLVGLGLAIGLQATRFFDCLICFTDAGPIGALRASVRFALARPGSFTGYVIVVWMANVTAVLVASRVAAWLPGWATGPMVMGLLAVSFAFVGAFHAVVFERRVVPAVCSPVDREGAPAHHNGASTSVGLGSHHRLHGGPLVRNRPRIALAILVLSGLLVGSATVRALDVRPVQDVVEPTPVDADMPPGAILDANSLPATRASYHAEMRTRFRNETTGAWGPPVVFTVDHDPAARRMRVRLVGYDDGGDPRLHFDSYFDTTVLAMNRGAGERPTGGATSLPPILTRTAGNWTVHAGPGYYFSRGHSTPPTGDGFLAQNWTVNDQGDGTIVLTARGADVTTIEGTDFPRLDADTWIEVHVDRQTGLVTRIEQELSRDPASDHVNWLTRRTVLTIRDWGTAEVDRPAAIGGPRPLELLWGVAYY